ncbi:MAG: hypothetical protein HYX72_09560 [Acidobacteria bacterium]|nr:hypothetical protein [Acidobacteriota bacterium]
MRRFTRIHLWLGAVVLIAVSALAQTITRKPVEFPSDLATTIRKDLDADACFQEDKPVLEQQISAEEINLTTTTTPALLVTGRGDCLVSSNGNASYLLYARFGNNWRRILRADGETMNPLAAMHNGWHDLEVRYRNSESEFATYTFRFEKTEYRATSCEGVLSAGSDPTRKPCPGWKPK